MEEKSLGLLVLLLGGVTYLFVGILTLISAALSYLITKIQLQSRTTLLVNPLSLQWFLVFAVFSIVQFVVAFIAIEAARSIYVGDVARAKGNSLVVLVTASVGIAVSYLWWELAASVGSGNLFMSFVYSPNTALIPALGFILSIAGALLSGWEASKASP